MWVATSVINIAKGSKGKQNMILFPMMKGKPVTLAFVASDAGTKTNSLSRFCIFHD